MTAEPDAPADVSPGELASLLEIARDVARVAGSYAAAERRAGVTVAATKSSPVDVVTVVDRDTEVLVRERLRAARPDDAIVGEEGEDEPGTSGLTWLVDPIDGTVNFLYDLPSWSVSIAVVAGPPAPDRWTQLVGAVYVPSSNELFTATRGGGAFLGERRLAVSAPTDLGLSLVATGFNYDAATRVRQAEVLCGLLGRVRDIRRLGSCAADLCALAAGRVDAFYELGLNAWDVAAASLIAREAGALVTGVNGGRDGKDLLVAAGPVLYPALCAALRDAGVPA